MARDRRGGEALMVIETDQSVPPVAQALISEIRGVTNVTYYAKEAS